MNPTSLETDRESPEVCTHDATAAQPADGAGRPDPLVELEKAISGIRASAVDYLVATYDTIRLRIRTGLIWLLLITVAAVVAVTVLVASTVLLLIGLSQAVAAGLGVSAWGGFVLVGGTAILVAFAAMLIGVRIWKHRSFEAAKARYEARHAKH